MRNVIFGAIGVLWGGGILLASLLGGKPQGGGAFGAGQVVGLLFGVLLLGAGAVALINGIQTVQSAPRKARPRPKPRRRRVREYDDE